MALKKVIQQAVISELKSLDLLHLNSYARDNNNPTFFRFLYSQGILNDKLIETALECAVLNHAEKTYDNLRKHRLYSGEIGMPECLVYAIKKKSFSPHELSQISFSEEISVENFCELYDYENLLPNLRERLLNPRFSHREKMKLVKSSCKYSPQ